MSQEDIDRAYDQGWCNAIMLLRAWITENLKPNATTKQVLEAIQEMTGLFK